MQHFTSRFWPLNDVETDAILHLNEEVNLTVDEVSAFTICGSRFVVHLHLLALDTFVDTFVDTFPYLCIPLHT